jgi:hypothetical protein
MRGNFNNTIFFPTLIALLFATSVIWSPARAQTRAQSQSEKSQAPPQSQTEAQSQTDKQVAKAATGANFSNTAAAPAPVFTEYRGLKIGMSASEVRDGVKSFLKDKGDKQDLLVLSDAETAQIYYDSTGKVTAISVDYLTKNGHAPTPMQVLGTDIQPKPDGSMYALKRYPAAGYWVSYNRTSGDNAIVTITMQAL